MFDESFELDWVILFHPTYVAIYLFLYPEKFALGGLSYPYIIELVEYH